MKRVIIYARVSTEDQEENGTSLDSQVDRCRAYAGNQQNWQIVDVVTEQYSGFKLAERKKLHTIREKARRREFDVLLCYDLDRLSRHQNHCAILFYEIEDQAGIELRFVLDNYENTPTGKFLRNTRAFIAEFERDKIRERTTRGILKAIEHGKPNWGPNPPYGYAFADEARRHLIEDPVAGAILRRIRRLLLAGVPLCQVARDLTNEGVPTPRQHAGRSSKGIWYPSTINALLDNPIYATGAFRQFAYSGERGHASISEDVHLIPDVAPPYWTPEELATMRHLIGTHRLSATRNNKNPEATLLRGGYARCAHCGRAMGVSSGTKNGRPRYFITSRRRQTLGCDAGAVDAKVLDTYVWSCLRKVIENPELVRRMVDHRQQQLHEDTSLDEELAAIEAVQQQLVQERQNLIKLGRMLDASDEDAFAHIAADLQQLTKREQGLRADHQRLEALLAAKAATQHQVQEFIDWCGHVRGNLETLDYAGKRRILAMLAVTVFVSPGAAGPPEKRFRLEWSLPFPLNDITIVDSSPTIPVGNSHPPIRLVWQEPLEMAAD